MGVMGGWVTCCRWRRIDCSVLAESAAGERSVAHTEKRCTLYVMLFKENSVAENSKKK